MEGFFTGQQVWDLDTLSWKIAFPSERGAGDGGGMTWASLSKSLYPTFQSLFLVQVGSQRLSTPVTLDPEVCLTLTLRLPATLAHCRGFL